VNLSPASVNGVRRMKKSPGIVRRSENKK